MEAEVEGLREILELERKRPEELRQERDRWASALGGGTVGNFVWGHYDDLEGDIAWHAARN
ncbi:hypothetical protein, partial [Microvirga aerilata]|uniref:hypothetical protein n=1 Tax=Microvirga aerilata TaxID=670292 RepID=UPI001AEDA9A3